MKNPKLDTDVYCWLCIVIKIYLKFTKIIITIYLLL